MTLTLTKPKVLLFYSSMAKNNEADPSLRIAPIGLFFINGYLKKKGYQTKIIHISRSYFEGSTQEDEAYIKNLKMIVQDFGPDYIGVSFRNLYNNGLLPDNPKKLVNFLTVSSEKGIIDFLRSISRAKIIGGGSAFSLAPKLYLKYLGLDYGIVGEGEIALEKLLSSLCHHSDVKTIPGLVYQAKEDILINPPEIIEDLHLLPEMGVGEYTEMGDFCYANGGYANIQTKRGCGFSCIYCVYPNLEGSRYRLRDIDKIINEIMVIKQRFGTNHFFFVDSVFSFPPEHSSNICRELISGKIEIQWSAFINPLKMNRKLLQIYKESGCHNLVCTFDTVVPENLKRYGKNFTIEDLKHCLELLYDMNIPFEVSMILGGPGEDEETVEETVLFCDTYLKDVPVVFNRGMWCHPGTPLKDIVKKENHLSEEKISDFDKIILSNDFATHNLLHYFMAGIKDGNERMKLINRIYKRIRRHKRIIGGIDIYFEKGNGNIHYADDLGVLVNQRPWYAGMKGRENPI